MLQCPPWTSPTASLAGTLDRQPVESRFAFTNPLLVHQLLPFQVVQSVHQPNRTFANARDGTDLPRLSWIPEKVGGEVDGASCDGHGASSIRNTKLACRSDDVTTDWLNVGREIKVVTVTAEEVFGTGGGVRVVVAVSGGTGVEIESLFKGFVALSKGFFRHLGKLAYLPKTAGDMGLTAGDEDASGDDGFHRLSSEEFFFVRALVDLLRYVADRLRERKLLTHGGDVSEGGEYVSFRS